eukprot:765521-Hanusia_phi.AAC.16
MESKSQARNFHSIRRQGDDREQVPQGNKMLGRDAVDSIGQTSSTNGRAEISCDKHSSLARSAVLPFTSNCTSQSCNFPNSDSRVEAEGGEGIGGVASNPQGCTKLPKSPGDLSRRIMLDHERSPSASPSEEGPFLSTIFAHRSLGASEKTLAP